ncbi:hypothetical protein Cni_G14074 [Canna indica]|uniref:Mediator of RNA polymerase II transcription subunit 32 n=1 Tax=Canna indica TaxID=4628 RepID=A0AAQ3QAC0_9LILI|nr:hypothetical protein Cni_G14074 [Canna indica]
MESAIDAMGRAYDELVAAIAGVIEASEASCGRPAAATAEAVGSFVERWVLFKESCDRAEVEVEMAARRIAAEHLMDAAASVRMRPAETTGLSPVSVPRLVRAMEAFDRLAADLSTAPAGEKSEAPAEADKAED